MRIFKGWPETPDPTKPKDDIRGEIPARALKFCEPFLAANRAGWLLYPPVDFTLQWNGAEIFVNFPDVIEETILLDRLFIPDFHEYWKKNAPAEAVEVMPPFMEAFPERGIVQIWSGLFIVTEPGISTWVRGPVNRTSPSAYSILEGIVETDWWTGPLFFVLQINKTDFPVRFLRTDAFLQVIPFPRDASANAESLVDRPRGLAEFTDELWVALRANAARRNTDPPGSYRRQARQRARDAVHAPATSDGRT
jgi:hypothetical protein